VEVLRLEYMRTLRELKKSHDQFDRQEKDLRENGYETEADETANEIKLINSMIRDVQESLDWIRTGRDPRSYNGVDKAYCSTWTPELLATCSEGMYDEYQNNVEKIILTRVQEEKLEDALCVLTANEKNVFMLHVIEGYSFQKIAELLGISKGSIQSYYKRSIDKIEHRKETSLFLVM
jgi:positive control factor